MEMPRPSEAHRKLERLTGSWVGEEKMEPSPWAPEGFTATGRSVARVALGDFAVITDYQQEHDGHVTFEGHGVYTYDPAADCYVQHWFDCMGTPPEIFRGTFDGDVLVMRSRGPNVSARISMDLSEEGRMTTRMEQCQDCDDWSLAFVGTYTRQG